MATSAFGIRHSEWNPILRPITQQVEDHPAFYPLSNENEAKKLLKDVQNHRYYLSFMNTSLEMEHRFFTQNAGMWSYTNGDPHRTPSLELLIPIIMHCKQTECRMLKRNSSAYNC